MRWGSTVSPGCGSLERIELDECLRPVDAEIAGYPKGGEARLEDGA